ncbi:threonine synthase [Aureisphaera galaxeae]|uniref:threonine synthase n=1 Tax=Aureisphaera galaxeae TaxID=1538023 RepID=UPI00234FF389|nr:threonine synthase [Aureisphaera galaxeae]MDC8003145.1 threonine synthase [Aureisphaera galaxeae]
MIYYSLNHNAPKVSFREAVVNGLAPDKGLYFPSEIKSLPDAFFEKIEEMDHAEIAFEAIKQFVGEDIPENDLKDIVREVLSFDFPVNEVEERVHVLELYHGPTLAFKDVGARFMARCLGYFNKNKDTREKVTVLVATSGDTGGAVASGFYEVEGVEVVILYPSGKVSDIQEKQLTTLGKNISAIEVEGTFDDCQAMVKKAFLDREFEGKRTLTSANSINVARWLPQMFYYFFAYKTLKSQGRDIVFSVPSGNFGNICAGMMAQKLGLPVHHFVTGTNANKIVPDYLKTGNYITQPSVATISNAMDVGAPSNFVRIQQIYDNDLETLRSHLSGYSYSDDETREAMQYLFKSHDYIADPHGAIGYLALKEFLQENDNSIGVFLETAHPVKFLDVIPENIASQIQLPEPIQALLHKEKKAEKISTYQQLKRWLILN